MADKQYQFRKGLLSKNSKNPYQDPTYLSFTLIFDTTSPLFNKEVSVKTLREFYKEEARANELESFIDTILLINREMPWYWISLDGVARAFEWNMLEPYRGGTEAKLTIKCNESINLAITGLMDLYRNSIYDSEAWTQILPENYRKFRMWVVVSEIRDIITEVPVNRTTSKNVNEDIVDDFRPLFKIQYDFCSFDLQSAKETFESLTSTNPESPAPSININYEDIKVIETSYLQGIMTEEIGNLGVATGATRTPLQSFGDRLSQDLQNIGSSALNTLNNTFENANPLNLFNGERNVYGSRLEQIYQRAINEIDGTANGLANMPGNIYKDAQGAATANLASFKTSLKQNIFGDNFGTVGAAIRQGSLNSIFPLINNP